MWSRLCLCLLVTTTLASPNWKENSQYEYLVRGRTLTSLHEVSNQYAGVLFKAILKIQPKSQREIFAQINDAQYSKIHRQLEHGWGTRFPEFEMKWEPLQVSPKPFKFLLHQGVINALVVSKDLDMWQINMIKAIISQFQLKIKDRSDDRNALPEEQGVLSTFTVKEETITGESETFYRINTVPDHLVHTYSSSEQLLNDDERINVFEITKHKNFTLNPLTPSYYYGFGGMDGLPSTNRIGSFFTRSSTGRVIISGDLNSYTIQNSHSVSEILASPTIGDKQKGSVYSMLNITLKQISKNEEKMEDIPNPLHLNSLIYSQDRNLEDDDLKQESFAEYMSYRRSSRNLSSEEMLQEEGLWSYDSDFSRFSEQEKKLITNKVRMFSKQIAEDLKNPYTMLVKATIDKFTILKHLIRFLNETELKQIGDELYEARKGSERDAWKIFRDSVAVSGTRSALSVIKEWIQTSRVEGVEAAVLVSTMAKTVRELSLEYLESLFELVKDEKVMSVWPLNDTSVLSFGQLVRQVFTDKNYSNAQYPMRRLEKVRSKTGYEFLGKVISFFSEELRSAIAAAATHKIHVNIRVLGNIAHPQILVAFKPYLEGNKQASQYQRLLMVLAMDKLAEFYPEEARAVLLRLYQNIGEDESVRATAVYQIMRTGPSAELLQYMASYTQRERHHFVAVAVKSAIESAAELKGEEYREIRQAAISAKPLLIRDRFGVQHGGSYLREHIVEELKLRFREALETVGAEDRLYPRGIKYTLQYNLGGLKSELVNFQTVVSSVDELMHVYKQQTEKYSQEQKKQQENHQLHTQDQWSSQYIAKILNLQMKQREQLEGNLYLENGIIQAMFPFANTTVPTMRKKINEWEQELASGKQVQHIKLLSLRSMNVAFPTEMGFLFSYSYEVPTMIRVHGSVQANANPRISQKKLNRPDSLRISTDLTATLTSKVQGRLSFVTPFDNIKYISGYDKVLQIHLPIRGNFEWDLKNNQIRADVQTKDSYDETRLLHYSTWPYTSRVETWKYNPVALSPETKAVRQENLRTYEKVLGKQHTGLALRIKIEHERQLIDIQRLKELTFKHGLGVGLMSSWNDAEIQYSNLNVIHLESESSTKKIVLTLAQKVQYRADSRNSQARLSNYVKPEERLEYAINMINTGMKNAKRESYDLSVEFQGERGKEIKYIVTGAYAKSDVDPNSRISLAIRKKTVMQAPYVFSFEANNLIENTNELDLKYMMENEPKMSGDWHIKFGYEFKQTSEIRAKWQLKRSESRKLYLQNLPRFRRCQVEMKLGDYQLPSCQNVTAEFNLLDNMEAKIQYEHIPEEMKEILKTLYYAIRFNYYLNTEVDSRKKSQTPNEVTVQGNVDPDLRSLNVSLKTSEEGATIRNIPLGEISQRLLVLHPVYHARSRLMGLAFGSEAYRASCVVDKTKMSTFLNLVYPAEISRSWTVMFQYVPKHASQRKTSLKDLRYQTKHYVVLVKDYMKKKGVKISLSSPETEFKIVDITMLPTNQKSGTKVLVDSKEVKVKKGESFEYAQGYIQIYALPNSELKVEVRDQFYVIFDGERVKLSLLKGKFRDATRGICGQYTGNEYEDLLSPSNCIVKDPKKFITSYDVESAEGQQVRKELESGNNTICTRKKSPIYTTIVKTSEDLKKIENTQENCTKFQTRYVEDGNEICFTLRPMPVCRARCRPESKSMKNVPVHCIKNSSVAQIWIKQINYGGSPDFSHKSESRSLPIELPNNCS